MRDAQHQWQEQDYRSQPVCQVPAARDQCLYLPQPRMFWVCVWIRWQTPGWTSWGVGCPGSRQGYQAGKGSVLVFRATHESGVPVGQVLHVYSEHPAGPASESRTHGVGKGGRNPVRGARQVEGPCRCSRDP